ncbi:MAG: pro-sigmaK processing inhibitor BofA family protein [Candidatus Micrarchaeia archaeon]
MIFEWFALSLIPFAIAAVVLIIAGLVIVFLLKKFIVNAALGVIALFAVNYLGAAYGVNVAVNFLTVALCGLLGLAGVGLLILASLAGFPIA